MGNAFMIGRRVLLRPIEESDAETYAEWINDPEMRQFLALRFPKSYKDEREWIASLSGKGIPTDLAFAVERKSDGKLIGSVGLHQIDWVQRRGVTGSFICPESLRGKGYGTEAKNLLIDYAFGELGLRSLWATVYERNAVSMRALEKQGYRRSGVFRKAVLVKGAWIDVHYYDNLREEWEELRAAGAAQGSRARRK